MRIYSDSRQMVTLAWHNFDLFVSCCDMDRTNIIWHIWMCCWLKLRFDPNYHNCQLERVCASLLCMNIFYIHVHKIVGRTLLGFGNFGSLVHYKVITCNNASADNSQWQWLDVHDYATVLNKFNGVCGFSEKVHAVMWANISSLCILCRRNYNEGSTNYQTR